MSMLMTINVILVAYLAAGRTGAIVCCLFLDIVIWQTLTIVLLIDLMQIPVYGLLIETSQRHLTLPKQCQMWIKRRSQKFQEWKERKKNLETNRTL